MSTAADTQLTAALSSALRDAETIALAADDAVDAIRDAIRHANGADDDLLRALFALIRELRLGSVFAPSTPAAFLDRLKQILTDAEIEIPRGVIA